MKKHNVNEIEYLNVYLTEDLFPKAFGAKLKELIGCEMTEQEARKHIGRTALQMELYYSPDSGLFMVESEAVEGGTIINPYTGKELEEEDDE
jgi:hypothetical protein